MSNESGSVAMTNVIGYFNGNKFDIHLDITRYNLTLALKPGEFIMDTRGRKINDPFFDTYSKYLSRELSTTPVPIIAIPAIQPVAHAPDGQSVRTVTEFRLNKHGYREPVMPPPAVQQAGAINTPSVRAMSMAEARSLRLVRTVRDVPEEYGVPDTSTGRPPSVSEVPEIAYAVDVPTRGQPKAKPAPLPVSLTEAAAPERQQLQAELEKEQQLAEVIDSSPTGFLNRVVSRAGATAQPAPPPAPLPEPLPEPSIDADPVENEAPATTTEAQPRPVPVRPARPAPKPLPPKRRYVCGADGRVFEFRSQLEQHVKRVFPSMLADLMAPYPPER